MIQNRCYHNNPFPHNWYTGHHYHLSYPRPSSSWSSAGYHQHWSYSVRFYKKALSPLTFTIFCYFHFFIQILSLFYCILLLFDCFRKIYWGKKNPIYKANLKMISFKYVLWQICIWRSVECLNYLNLFCNL